jgi:hypothetical protein
MLLCLTFLISRNPLILCAFAVNYVKAMLLVCTFLILKIYMQLFKTEHMVWKMRLFVAVTGSLVISIVEHLLRGGPSMAP